MGNLMGKIFVNTFYPFEYPDVTFEYPEEPVI